MATQKGHKTAKQKDRDAWILKQAKEAVEKSQKAERSDCRPQLNDNENSKDIFFRIRIASLPDIDTDNAEEVQHRIEEYMTLCANDGRRLSIAELAVALGIDRNTLFYWLSGKCKGKPETVLTTLKKAIAIINAQYEEWLNNNKINPVAAIFLMKNNMGYTDKTEIEIAPTEDKQNDIASLTSAADLLDDTITGQITDNSTE